MKKSTMLFAAAAAAGCLLTGCGDRATKPEPTEAELFGYKGEDLVDQETKTFLVTNPAVTNWVPERVVSVVEKYDLSADETALIAAAGILMPGATYEKIPAEYAKDGEEPWFTWWVKGAEAFGLKNGRIGILTHFNEDKKVWESNESYFSTYWPTKEEAEKALASVRAQLAESYGVKKFHDLDAGWVAEYVRLGVMGVVGQKADGTWSCMIDFRDKGNAGCGPWESIADQQERRNQYDYAVALRAWRAKLTEVLSANHERVAAAAKAKGLTGVEQSAVFGTNEAGLPINGVSGAAEPQKTAAALKESFEALWKEQVAFIEKAFGVKAQGEPSGEEIPEQGVVRAQLFAGDLYEVRLDAFMPAFPEALPAPAPAEGEAAAEAEPPVEAAAQWRILFTERLQEGLTLPAKPQLKK